jgi:hypothetical protein
MKQPPPGPSQQSSYGLQWEQQPSRSQYSLRPFKQRGSLQPLSNQELERWQPPSWEQLFTYYLPQQQAFRPSLIHQCPYIHRRIRLPYPAVVQAAPRLKKPWYCFLLRIGRALLIPIIGPGSARSAGKSVSREEGNVSSPVIFHSPGGFAVLLRES